MEKIKKLSNQDVKRFYRIWLSTLNYVNEKYKINRHLKDLPHDYPIDPQTLLPIRAKLWSDDHLLDEAAAANPYRLSKREIRILLSWKSHINERFVVLKHLKYYTIFMAEHNVYGVRGITTPLDEIFPAEVLPVLTDTVLLPFEGKIITDSLFSTYPVGFGGVLRKILMITTELSNKHKAVLFHL